MWLIVVGVAPSSLAEDLATLIRAKCWTFDSLVHIDVSSADRDRGRVCTLMVMELS